jgi:cobalt-zinc-cadmium efflux system protein
MAGLQELSKSNSVDLALDAVPKHINLEKVREFLLTQTGVESVHDIHIWAMSTTKVALTAHLIIPGAVDDRFIGNIQRELEREFGINHTTLQIENKDMEENCKTDF